jgi:RNA polymerase-binding protein DksA
MAKHPRQQQRTDARRVGKGGTGKLDRAAAGAPARGEPAPATGELGEDTARDRIVRARDAAIAELQRLGVSPDDDHGAPRGATAEAVLDEGDEAQASERQEMSFAHRERLAERINQLTRALERLAGGTYGRCEMCGNPIGAERLAAIPEAATCRECQERREREAA